MITTKEHAELLEALAVGAKTALMMAARNIDEPIRQSYFDKCEAIDRLVNVMCHPDVTKGEE